MEVLQCPVCELKFRFASEVEDHLKLEHPDFAFERDPVRGSPLDEARRKRHEKRPNE
ncbi:MAG TPA: hypothetical protein VIG64_07850 [Actinomycetota bacterium]|jgi:hypothetical protein